MSIFLVVILPSPPRRVLLLAAAAAAGESGGERAHNQKEAKTRTSKTERTAESSHPKCGPCYHPHHSSPTHTVIHAPRAGSLVPALAALFSLLELGAIVDDGKLARAASEGSAPLRIDAPLASLASSSSLREATRCMPALSAALSLVSTSFCLSKSCAIISRVRLGATSLE